MGILTDRCVNPNCRELIRYEEGTQEIRCPWCDYAFMAHEFEGEFKKVVEAINAGKQAQLALALEQKEKEALQVKLNESHQKWIAFSDVQKQVEEQLQQIDSKLDHHANTLAEGHDEIISAMKKNQRENQKLLHKLDKLQEAVNKQTEDMFVYVPPKPEVLPEEERGFVQVPPKPEVLPEEERGFVQVPPKPEVLPEEERSFVQVPPKPEILPEEAEEVTGSAAAEKYAVKASPEKEFILKDNDDGGYTVVKYNGTREQVCIPEKIRGRKVTRIAKKAFCNHQKMQMVIIPDSVITIGKSAFARCKNLTSVHIGDGIAQIMKSAFAGCLNLETVRVGEGIREFRRNAFSGCRKLNVMTFGKTSAVKPGIVHFPRTSRVLGYDMLLGTDIREVMLSKATAAGKLADMKKLAVFYYPEGKVKKPKFSARRKTWHPVKAVLALFLIYVIVALVIGGAIGIVSLMFS